MFEGLPLKRSCIYCDRPSQIFSTFCLTNFDGLNCIRIVEIGDKFWPFDSTKHKMFEFYSFAKWPRNGRLNRAENE